MARTFAAALRRANRLMRPARQRTSTRSRQKAMTDFMISSAFAPLAAAKPKKTKTRKATTPKVSRKLGAVLKQLRAAQSLMPGAKSRPTGRKISPRIPAGAHYLSRQHRSARGSRCYKLYLPASQPKRPKGLILMLHGCNQTPDDFAVGTHMNTLAEKHGLAVAWPAQTGVHNAASCWNRFKPGNRRRGHVRSDYPGADGAIVLELWQIEGAGHAWSGGRAAGSYTDNKGPDASAQMIRFFLATSG